MMTVSHPIALIAVVLWTGFLLAISFMESWLKFRTPGLSKAMGLKIGQRIFKALNLIEWFFTCIILISLVLSPHATNEQYIPFIVTVLLLLWQSIWLLPALNQQVDAIVRGEHRTTSSKTHLMYILAEICKLICLAYLITRLFVT